MEEALPQNNLSMDDDDEYLKTHNPKSSKFQMIHSLELLTEISTYQHLEDFPKAEVSEVFFSSIGCPY